MLLAGWKQEKHLTTHKMPVVDTIVVKLCKNMLQLLSLVYLAPLISAEMIGRTRINCQRETKPDTKWEGQILISHRLLQKRRGPSVN